MGQAGAQAVPPAILAAEHQRSLGTLETFLAKDPATAARAALAIARTKDPGAAAILRAHVTAADPSVRAMVVYGLGLVDDTYSLTEIRKLATHDRNSAVRYAGLDAIGRIVNAAPALGTNGVANDVFLAVRSDDDPIVRAHAAAALEAFRKSPIAPSLAPAIERAFASERDDDVRWHLMWTVFRGYAKNVDVAFLAAGLTDRSELVRIESLRAWGRRDDRGIADRLRPLLNDPSWRVQYEAREAIRRANHEAPTEHLAAIPDGIHLPPIDPHVGANDVPILRPSGLPAPVAPVVADIPTTPALLPTSAALMNGPMPGPHPRVRVTTSKGTFIVRLYPEWAPFTVANFLNLTNRAYFDGLRWFRVVPDFVVQTGDTKNTGDGDAGYTIGAEENPVEQRSGIISMGLDYKGDSAIRDSAGTQFYITLSPQLHLDRDFTVFGEVEDGFPVLAHLIESDTMIKVEQIESK